MCISVVITSISMKKSVLLKVCLWITASCCAAQDVINMAFKKKANQSSTHRSFTFASVAVDGRIPGGNITEFLTCIHTLESPRDDNPWWEVDLGQTYPVLYITIYARPSEKHRMLDTNITIDGQMCFTIKNIFTTNPFNLYCNTALTGRIVRMTRNSRDRNDISLNICEVQVWGCRDGKYGWNCSQSCGNCANSSCDKVTGRCPSGCVPGWTNDSCQTVCKPGTYGLDCAKNCGQCHDLQACDTATGRCLNGCEVGWRGNFCKEKCEDGKFGPGCTSWCGQCNDSTCNKVSGRCPQGCLAGWHGDLCNKQISECPQYTFGENCNSTCGQCKDNATCHHVSGNCSFGCAAGWTGDRCDEVAAEDEVNMMMWIALGGGSLLGLIIIIIVVVVLIRSRRKYDLNRTTLPTRPEEDITLAERDCLSDRYSHLPASSSSSYPRAHLEVGGHPCTQLAADENRVQMNRLKIYVLDKLQSAELEREFSQLTTSQVFESTVGASRKNQRKNRFKDILPYDHSRVTLERVDGDDGSDYINASYIKGYQQDKAYIATQGPKQNTADDFWLMMWQEHVTQIVMVTKVVTKPKKTAPFFKYWPSAGEKRRYGQVDVTNVDEVNKAHFIVRTFSVKQDNEYRFVEQFQFTGFTDQETPSAVSFVGFWRFVNSRASRNETSPPIIHCSAGVSLTGVYIALDIVMKQAEFERETNIFDVVNRIRQDRCNMVKNKEYYLFLHRTVLEACVSHYTCLDMETFNSVFEDPVQVHRPNDLIEWQFQNLIVLPDAVVDGYYATLKDVQDTVVRKSLRIEVDGRFMSTKAFFLPTLLDVHGILVSPPTNSAETVWRLVENYNVNKIVSLGNDLCGKKQEAVLYWPTQTESRVQARPYTVTLTDKVKMTKCLTGYCMTWQRQQKSAQVQLMHYNDWEGELPCNVGELANLLITLTKRVHERHQAPLLVVSMEGIARSCLFCVMCHLLGQITVDGQVDVFTAIRHVQSVVPDFMVTVEQYRFCYLMAQQLDT